jgi:hypothetical protein
MNLREKVLPWLMDTYPVRWFENSIPSLLLIIIIIKFVY